MGKYGMLLLVLAMAVILVSGCVHKPVFSENEGVLNLSEMTAQDYERVFADVQSGKPVVIRVAPGTKLPVIASLDLPFVAIGPETLSMEVRQQMYLGITKDGLWMSPDGRVWNPVQNFAKIKQSFGMNQGQMSLGFAASKEKGPYVNFSVTGKESK